MISHCTGIETFEISPRFRQSVEERILRLERDADQDEVQLQFLRDGDHIRRHTRLVAMQRAEALRMRVFLDRAKPNFSRAMIVH
jgi:ribosome-associated translation inhibitor RaiA